jgi:hypothetical protein
MSSNTRLEVQVANGCYHPATPSFAAEFRVHQRALEPEPRDDFRLPCHPTGHAKYAHPPSRRQPREGIVAFIECATSRDGG